ncbi:hypothetical protein WME90_05700 [Sorangium sp. So ce375]|uniref:hypothetical protein n=1 Tax=Sorangium sp. So ce375 TaxID=3133306 RepID=UPI003F5BC317
MEAEQRIEYGTMTDDVYAKLRVHAYVDDRYAGHVFQYLVLPSFGAPVAWDVFRRRREGYDDDHVLVRTTWDCGADRSKFSTPVERLRHPYPLVPTIEVHQLAAPSDTLRELAVELAGLEIRIGSLGVGGLDGTTYEIALDQPPHHIPFAAKCRLSFWHEPPTGWRGLGAWVSRAERVFIEAWSTHGPAARVPLPIRAIDDGAARQEAQRAFHAGSYARAAELLADVASRERLTPAEAKMLELALKRMGGGRGG